MKIRYSHLFGRCELIQSWCRLSIFRRLLEDTSNADRWGWIRAGIAARGEALDQLYRRLVDENMVCKDLSHSPNGTVRAV